MFHGYPLLDEQSGQWLKKGAASTMRAALAVKRSRT
jgi:hypothetical protein